MNYRCRDINNTKLTLKEDSFIELSCFDVISFEGKNVIILYIIEKNMYELSDYEYILKYKDLNDMYDDIIDLQKTNNFCFTSRLEKELTKRLNTDIYNRRLSRNILD